jgi:hypothetical protein
VLPAPDVVQAASPKSALWTRRHNVVNADRATSPAWLVALIDIALALGAGSVAARHRLRHLASCGHDRLPQALTRG